MSSSHADGHAAREADGPSALERTLLLTAAALRAYAAPIQDDALQHAEGVANDILCDLQAHAWPDFLTGARAVQPAAEWLRTAPGMCARLGVPEGAREWAEHVWRQAFEHAFRTITFAKTEQEPWQRCDACRGWSHDVQRVRGDIDDHDLCPGCRS